MNCRDAREQLEAVRPGTGDGTGAEFAQAQQHLAGCAVCRRVVRSRERIDRDVSRAMRDVVVPAGLKSRILDSLRISGEVETAAADSPTQWAEQRRLRTRRWILAAAGTAAAALLISLGVHFLPESTQPEALLTLGDLRRQATLSEADWADLEPFDGNFVAKPPGGIWNRPGIRIEDRPQGDLPDANGYHRVALFQFRVALANDHRMVRGVLLVIPRRRLDDPPSRVMPVFEDRAENYARRASGTYHSFAWQTDEFVYVCFVPKDGHSLETLTRVVSGPNA